MTAGGFDFDNRRNTTMHFTIKKGPSGYVARLFGGNGKLVWWTEGYTTEANALHAIQLAMDTNRNTPIYRR